ncbi:AAA family ATPase [Paenarthrobacter sp. JL.01a]|uniref:AAA family ATPase n=1 Tax=Paenarthrobacter sp. JL.01a TaxID=2979324 RepID=UPI0021C9602F|nr:AAA family ATPase [Paenarthrobacter sp. JL.01a]UXM92843.1 AAA family ATPase [Paenarthrobacter sp. JL.01a]
MSTYGTGLVIGKFYPPHAGHRHLIEVAAAESERLFVIVLGSRFESLPMEDRARWLSLEFASCPNVQVLFQADDCPVDYQSEEIWKAHVELMRLALKGVGVGQIDAVFTSEMYGHQLADALKAQHVVVDPERRVYPVSGTMCRDDLNVAWPHIVEPARQGLATRIIVVGAESTGTTTLTRSLMEHYRSQFPTIGDVPEYGRLRTYDKLDELRSLNPDSGVEDLVWTADDFSHIATRQNELENAAASQCPLVIADTDSLATVLWERRYMGVGSFGAAEAAGNLPRRDLYLLTDHEGVDFEDDGFRDGEHIRADMTEWFKDALASAGHSWVLVTGSHECRMATATGIIDLILEQRSEFTSPPWATRTVLTGAVV